MAQVVMMQYGVLVFVILSAAKNPTWPSETAIKEGFFAALRMTGMRTSYCIITTCQLHHDYLPGKFLSAAKNVRERQKKKHKRHHQMKHYYVYILANRYKTLYTGVTNNLLRRLDEHKQHLAGFTSKYDVTRLVYFEETSDVHVALEREKCIKSWLRAKKVALIETGNPDWRDLSEEWEGG